MPTIRATPQMLAEARADYHALMTGNKARVVVDQNGERVEFTSANASRLYAYIMELQSALPAECGALSVTQSVGPVGFTF